MREVLTWIRRPLDVGILVHRVHDEAAYEKATSRNFGGPPHRITLRDRGVERNFWWVQDYIESGSSSRGETILIPRRIFEGAPGNGEVFEPLLARLSRQGRVVRSRLSWEGGDLQFTRDPGDARRLVLFYGSFAKPYWGESLSQGEFEYVLSLEFGADRAVDLGGLAPHVDYFVSFLTGAKTAEREEIGFRVIRIPAFRGDLTVERSWPGISYVNGLVVDTQIFVPRFGLGEVEDRLFRDVAAQLPRGYSIVPIYAQPGAIRNGGA